MVKIQGRCVIAPSELSLMQEIVLFVSFYINSSVFMEGDKSSFKLEVSTPVDPTVCPLPTLFRLLKMKPSQKAEFTPEELDTRKRSLSLSDNARADDESQVVGLAKRRKGGSTYAEQSNDEQAISESSLNKLVGAVELYDLKVLPLVLDSTLFPVCLRLAAVAYRKEHIHLEKWLNENLNMYKDTFFEDCLVFLKEVLSDVVDDVPHSSTQQLRIAILNAYQESCPMFFKVCVCAFQTNAIGLRGIGISPDCNPENRATPRQLFNWVL